ncbi:MAG: gliding motility-associated C-terminal domain-containing protein [Bacteroidales bacterium]|nr:gliding motility-associated C-terminal domain-containing protein [Bacteroidales bacterium]
MRYVWLIIWIVVSKSLLAQDIWPPDVPKLDSVSVYDVNTGATIISWYPCDSADVAGYRIYRSINALWQPIANVPAPATSYIDNGASANFHPELYRIAAYDQVGNLSAMTPDNRYHQTIYVFPYQDSINCHFAIRLNWNRYINWEEGVKEYKIYVSENFGPFVLLATLPGNSNQYYHMDVNDNTSYCYQIRAISNNNKTSTSNKTCFFTDFPNLPTFIYADNATVLNNKIQISFTLDANATICRYQLQRSADGQNFQPIDFFAECGSSRYTYTDASANVEKRYYYRLVALDQCNQVRLSSNIASNVVLQATATDEVQNIVQWNRYQTWQQPIDSVYLYRIREDAPTHELIYSSAIAYDTLRHDNLTQAVLQNPSITNKFCYYVVQTEKNGNTFGMKGRSRSNTSCAFQAPRVFIPNTFTPNGDDINNTFKPSIAFVEKEGYLFKIFDRWGSVVFETTDPLKGWDGTQGGKVVPSGMYVYLLNYRTLDGSIKERCGSVYVYFP